MHPPKSYEHMSPSICPKIIIDQQNCWDARFWVSAKEGPRTTISRTINPATHIWHVTTLDLYGAPDWPSMQTGFHRTKTTVLNSFSALALANWLRVSAVFWLNITKHCCIYPTEGDVTFNDMFKPTLAEMKKCLHFVCCGCLTGSSDELLF